MVNVYMILGELVEMTIKRHFDNEDKLTTFMIVIVKKCHFDIVFQRFSQPPSPLC